MRLNVILQRAVDRTILKVVNRVLRQLSDSPFLIYEIHRRAVMDSVDYAESKMPLALHFNFREDLWDYAFNQKPAAGLILEFGVWQGHSINYFSEKCRRTSKVFGFDSFIGLKEDWQGNDREKGHFSLGGQLPKVRENVHLLKGFFDETLPRFLEGHPGDIAFIHFDADTYEATRVVFSSLPIDWCPAQSSCSTSTLDTGVGV